MTTTNLTPANDPNEDLELVALRRAYIQHSDYELTGSIASAQAFFRTCRAMQALLIGKRSVMVDGAMVTFDPQTIDKQLTDARRWLASQGALPGSTTSRIYDQSRIRG
ncbi:MAG: hypothetical protein AAFP90_18405 [Planctomycetota bacterium]